MDSPLVRLARILAEYFPDAESAMRLLAETGISTRRINMEAEPGNRWYRIVLEGQRSGRIPALLAAAIADYPDDSALQQLSTEMSRMEVLAPDELLPLLVAAIGSDAALSLDLASLRAVRTSTGMEFARIPDATLDKLKAVLDRERAHGRKVNVHLAVHASPEGIELGGKTIDAAALSEILDGVQVLVIAGCESSQMADFLGVVPWVVSMSEAVTHTDAAIFTQMFWKGIGMGNTARLSLRDALARAPGGMREMVSKSW